jgi:hypothetical protein
MTTASTIVRSDTAPDTVTHGDCIKVMGRMASAAVDFVLTDPPYIARYLARDGRSVINDDNAAWLQPAFTQMYRLLKPGSFCVSFYGWSKADRFIAAWRSAGFRWWAISSSARNTHHRPVSCATSTSRLISSPRATSRHPRRRCRTCSTGPIPATGFIRRKSRCKSCARLSTPSAGQAASYLIPSAVQARHSSPPGSLRADSSVSNLIARTISPRRGVSGKRRFADDDGSPLPRSLFGPPEAGRTACAFCAGRGAPRPGDFRPIGPRSGGQRRGLPRDRRTRGATRKGMS